MLANSWPQFCLYIFPCMCIKFSAPETLTKYIKDCQGSLSQTCKQLKVPLPNSPNLVFDYGVGFLGRPPGPEMEYCTDRESYSLAAGLALGMVCLGVNQIKFVVLVLLSVLLYSFFYRNRLYSFLWIFFCSVTFFSSFSLQTTYLFFFSSFGSMGVTWLEWRTWTSQNSCTSIWWGVTAEPRLEPAGRDTSLQATRSRWRDRSLTPFVIFHFCLSNHFSTCLLIV